MCVSTVDVLSAYDALTDRAVITMLVDASNDPALCDATYLPAKMGKSEAAQWLEERQGRGFVIYLDHQPVGWLETAAVKDDCGFALPERTVELEIWLLPHARGKRLYQVSLLALAERLLAQGVEYILSVAWITNHSSIQAMHRAGFTRLGDGWWGDQTTGGMCTVGLLRLGGDH